MFKSKSKSNKTPDECFILFGLSAQSLGKILTGDKISLNLDSKKKKLEIIKRVSMKDEDNIVVSIPYERLRGFILEDETTCAQSGSTLGRALAGGLLFGGVGAIVGGISSRGKTKTRWFATIKYINKDGQPAEISFMECGVFGKPYEGKNKSILGRNFEARVNEISLNYIEDINEL